MAKSKPRIGIDLMGSDTPPDILFKVADLLHDEKLPADFVFFATHPTSFETVIAEEVISMEDDPIEAVRRKKGSSIHLGLRHLQEKKIDAFISAGNTGALFLAAKTILNPLPEIERPALLTLLPTNKKEVAVLDVGANLSLKPHHFLQLALMGIAYQKSRGVLNPTVGLLNIGSEESKGTPHLRQAYQELEKLNEKGSIFVGNIEGKEVYKGAVDVLVTDGFTGNIFLKTAEGLAALVLSELEELALQHEPSETKEILSKLYHRLHYSEFPGALLCGVEGIVIKCHGDVTPGALVHAAKVAMRLVKHDFLAFCKNLT